MEVIQFPGSIYPTATKAPGPEKASKLRQKFFVLGISTVPLISSKLLECVCLIIGVLCVVSFMKAPHILVKC